MANVCKAEKRSNELFEEIEQLRAKSENLGAKIDEAKQKYNAAWERINFLGGIVGELNGKRIEQRAKHDNVQKLKRNLKEMTDSDESLQNMLEEYQTRVGELHARSEAEKRNYSQLSNRLQQSRNQLSSKEREYGSFEAQKANYDRQVEHREQLVKQTARKHNIRGYELDVDEEKVMEFMAKIAKMAETQQAAFDRARRETQQHLSEAQKVLNQISESRSALNQKKESARATIAANDRRINAFFSELDKIDVDEGGKAMLESSIKDTESKLQSAKDDFKAKDWDKQVAENDSKLRGLDDHKERLDSELVQATKQAGDSARLDYLQKEIKDREHSLKTMVNAHGTKITKAIDTEWEPSTLETEFQNCLERVDRHLQEAQRQRDGTTRELDQVTYRLKTVRDELKTNRKDLESKERDLRTELKADPTTYPQELDDAEQYYERVKTDFNSSRETLKWWNKALSRAQEKRCCLMCSRDYGNSNVSATQFGVFQNMIRNEIKKAKDASDPENMKEAEDGVKELKEMRPIYDTWMRLKDAVLPPLVVEEGKMASRRQALVEAAESQDREVDERSNAKHEVESLSKTVQSIIKYSTEATNLHLAIEELSKKQKQAGLSRGLEAIQDDLKRINEQSRAMKVSLTKIVGDRDGARGIINTLELELRDNRSKLSTAVYQLREKTSLENQVNDLKKQNAEHKSSQQSTENEIRSLGPQLEEAQMKYDEISRRGGEKDRQLQAEKSSLESSVNELKMANRDIEDYVRRGGPDQLSKAKSAIEDFKKTISNIEEEMNSTAKQVKAFENDLRNVEETKRHIAENQDYRRDVKSLQELAAEIQDLESHNAEQEKAEYEDEGNRWEMERNRLTADQASMMGQLKSKDDQLQQLLQDWETEYKGAADKYKEAHIKVETTKAAVEDLARYGGALDQAIMKYHSLKMEEINRIIEELWRKTYQGTDVDSVLIRSENENVKNNKNYNYRVVMVKQEAEMDMRGRCSAGQKVLASIIIRLALAECFGVNCGLIALDEPTTNLDRDNIRALAESLAEIIRVRRQQRNFQLIVITHDEEFLRYMQCADFCDNYYRVSRNEKQKSIIIRQNIAEVCF